ncbi:MAG TPA: permease-like cell division protein FtsX [Candidatus Saccharimonadales bacterium]|nr:permease-like cell division protein FtsX [Candidatus Saccharimonadales bacterium]
MSGAYVVAEAWRGLRRARGVAVASGVSLFAAWVVLAGTADALWNGWRFVRFANARKEVVVLMKESLGAEADSVLGARLRGLQEVAGAEYVSRDSAWAQLSRDLNADPDLLQSVGSNPLPPSYRLSLRPDFSTAAEIERLAQTIRQYPEVGDVVYGGEWLGRLETWLGRFTLVGVSFGGAVALGVVVLVMLVIRLAILARRDVLRVLYLLGAGAWFIRLPFLVEGLILTAVTSALALAAVEGASRLAATRWGGWSHLPLPLDAAFVGLALLLGLLGSLVGSWRVGRVEGS